MTSLFKLFGGKTRTESTPLSAADKSKNRNVAKAFMDINIFGLVISAYALLSILDEADPDPFLSQTPGLLLACYAAAFFSFFLLVVAAKWDKDTSNHDEIG